MSDTPLTDAVWDAAKRPPLDGPEKWIDALARNLERQNRELLDFIETVASGNTEIEDLERQAKKILDGLTKSEA